MPLGVCAGPAGLEHPKKLDTFPVHQGVLEELIPDCNSGINNSKNSVTLSEADFSSSWAECDFKELERFYWRSLSLHLFSSKNLLAICGIFPVTPETALKQNLTLKISESHWFRPKKKIKNSFGSQIFVPSLGMSGMAAAQWDPCVLSFGMMDAETFPWIPGLWEGGWLSKSLLSCSLTPQQPQLNTPQQLQLRKATWLTQEKWELWPSCPPCF